MKTTHFKSNYEGLSELFGLPAVGKTTFLKINKQYININNTNNRQPMKRYSLKLISFLYIIIFDFTFFKSTVRFIGQSKLSFGDSLRLFLNMLRVKRESLKYKDRNMMSDQGFFQAVWSVSVFSFLEREKMTHVLMEFFYENQKAFPKKVIVLEDNFDDILDREINRYGKLGSYYSDQIIKERAQYFQELIVKFIQKNYILGE